MLAFLLLFTWSDVAESCGHLMLNISKYYLSVSLLIPATVPKVVYDDQELFYT